MTNSDQYYINETEDSLLRVASDHYDLVQIISKCPECFEAYKSLIQKKRLAAIGGGLTADNSQQNSVMLNGISSASK